MVLSIKCSAETVDPNLFCAFAVSQGAAYSRPEEVNLINWQCSAVLFFN